MSQTDSGKTSEHMDISWIKIKPPFVQLNVSSVFIGHWTDMQRPALLHKAWGVAAGIFGAHMILVFGATPVAIVAYGLQYLNVSDHLSYIK